MHRWIWLSLVLCAAPAWADNPHSGEPAVISSQVTVEPIIKLVAQGAPPYPCGEQGSDGTFLLTKARELCLCDGAEARWINIRDGAACSWGKP